MALATIAATAAPAVANFALNRLTEPRETAYERRMRSLSEQFMQDARTPYFSTSEGSNLLNELERVDRRNRTRTRQQSVTGQATDEQELAGHHQANQAMAEGVARAGRGAGRHRDRSLSMAMQTLGAAEEASRQSEAEHQQQISGITQGIGQAGQAFMLSSLYQDDVNPAEGGYGGSTSEEMASQISGQGDMVPDSQALSDTLSSTGAGVNIGQADIYGQARTNLNRRRIPRWSSPGATTTHLYPGRSGLSSYLQT